MAAEQKLKGDWNQVAGTVREKYGEFTDDEMRQAQGNSQKLIGIIQKKTGQGREQVEAFVHSVFKQAGVQYSNLSEATSEYAHATGDAIERGYEQTNETISRHPMESVGVAFALGLIGGLVLGISLAEARHPDPSWRNAWRS